MLKRTNIYLQRQLLDYLRERAQEERESMAELIRRTLQKEWVKEKKNWAESLFKLSKDAATSSLGDLSEKHDKYLYGKKSL